MRSAIVALVLALTLSLPGGLAAAKKKGATQAPAMVKVQYFHGSYRCYSCNKIESMTREVVEKDFAKDVKGGALSFTSYNVEEKEHRHFIEDYKLSGKSVVVAREKGGKRLAWKNLDQIWMLLRDEAKFKAYIGENVKSALAAK